MVAFSMMFHGLLWCIAATIMCMVITRCSGQTTDFVSGSCTYSFVVPQVDSGNTCSGGGGPGSKTIDELSADITNLQQQMQMMISRNATSSQLPNDPFNCDCSSNVTFMFSYRDCQDMLSEEAGNLASGLYPVTPVISMGRMLSVQDTSRSSRIVSGEDQTSVWVAKTGTPFMVYCDIDEDVGWTVLMKRRRFDVDFNRTWSDYKHGFGNLESGGDFWLGLEKMHKLTGQAYISYNLMMIFTNNDHHPHTSTMTDVQIGDEQSGYMITYSETSGETVFASKDIPFTTFDHDGSDAAAQEARLTTTTQRPYWKDPVNEPMMCASEKGGGWWYHPEPYRGDECGWVRPTGSPKPSADRYRLEIVRGVEMKIKPAK